MPLQGAFSSRPSAAVPPGTVAPHAHVGTRPYRSVSSLSRRVGALGVLAVVAVSGAIALGILLLRQSRSVRLRDASQQLTLTSDELARRYDQLSGPRAQEGARPRKYEDSELRALTERALASTRGVEGGFWDASSGQILGYAYPTYQGSGPKTDVPPAERAAIEQLAGEATREDRILAREIDAASDAILLRAHPLTEGGHPVGAVWLMQRLAGVDDPRRTLYQLGLVLLLATGALGAGSAFFFTRRIDSAIASIEHTLRRMEEHLDLAVPAVGILELDRIGEAIGRLGKALSDTQARRAALEGRLREADRLAALGTLVAGVAHEVRNPLASMKLKLQLSQALVAGSPQLGGTFAVLQDEVGRLDRLVQRLLLIGRSRRVEPIPTDVGSLVAERVALWEQRASQERKRVVLSLLEGLGGPVYLERDSVGQILDNLIANGLDAAPSDGGEVAVEVARNGSLVTLAVSDTGPGVAPEVRPHLFEPFFTTRSGGTGLGLFLSAELARRLGGELRHLERPGGGARFEVRLPC